MTKIDLKKIVENLIQTFLYAGKISLELREKGLTKEIKLQEKKMFKAAKNMEFEEAAKYRDELKKLKDLLFIGFSGKGL